MQYTNEQKSRDADMVCGLIAETLPEHSCLVFCQSRNNCENVAQLLCKSFLDKKLKQYKSEEKKSLFKAIVEEGGGIVCPTLKRTLPYGVAYHHSGK